MAQKNLPVVRYTINAKLNDIEKTIDGQWDAVYVNHADSSLHSVWILLYPNAFSSDHTSYSEDLLKWGNTSYYFGKAEDRGWIDSLDFTVDGKSNIILKPEMSFSEFIQIPLEKPLAPGDSVHLSTTFFTHVPFNFANDGYRGNDFILKAWCPLIADLNKDGWMLQPYSAFYANNSAFADYIVEIACSNSYSVKTNGTSNGSNKFNYQGELGFQWVASKDKNFLLETSLDRGSQDSIKTMVAKHIFPDIFRSGRAPQKPSQWLTRVYERYKQSIPFIDSIYRKDTVRELNKKTKLGFLYDFRNTEKYNYVLVSPAVGFNNYDKVMVGALVHNYQLPEKPLSFALAPMYAIGSKKFAGWGDVAYNVWNTKTHWRIGVSGSTFSRRDFDIPDYPKFYQRIWRIVPAIDVTIFDKELPSTRKIDVGFRSFILSQQNYSMFTNGNDTSFGNVTDKTTLFRLSGQLSDSRKLYPYSVNLTADAGKEFLRLGLTGKYFFNYDASNRGVSARLFAGKFFYLKEQTNLVEAKNQVYNFGLSGPSGIYDYTYSDYFIGRNESQGWMSQQIMERDGFFKIPSQSLSGGVSVLGMSDNWLTATNLTADFPRNLDPLRYVGGGLKLFFDLGTYSDLWSDVPPAGRFLYDAGLQVSLFKSLVNIYVPVIYSKVYKDKLPTDNRFWKTVSFSINLSALQPRNRNFLWPQ
ncbi:MAG: hypothetical protein DI598_00765 [Pseudopedobacter saltans]|uniref:Aminopeptidase n=1 Tax=Pseudopedobacter saltans TaxID=151895 RepID=A0A2W5F8P4_9SPHI|nr:MAG: hypothetical protein DI598_00765 [Pseudopedobacter saltans]